MIRVKVIPNTPLPIVFGGFELQSLATTRALAAIGYDIGFLDISDPTQEFDLLHCFGPGLDVAEVVRLTHKPVVVSAIFAARGAARLRGVLRRVVAAGAGLAHESTTFELRRQVLLTAKAVLCLNQLEANFAMRCYGVPAGTVKVVPNGVDDVYFNPESGVFSEQYGIEDFVLFVGSITERKNPLTLARALGSAGLTGVFIGAPDATQREYVDEFTNEVVRNKRLHWVRGLSYDDPALPSAYAAASAFCLPSFSETQSLAALQALAAGLPVVLADRPYAHQAPFQNVVRCNPNGSADVERAILTAIRGASKAHIVPTIPSWSAVANQIASVYQDIL